MVKESELTITRVFNAPVETVWKAWTNPEMFMKWWGPKPFTSPACQMDLRVGGKYLFCMHSPEGMDYWSTGVYREIVPMTKIAFTDSFSDNKGNVVPASHYGMAGDYPKELYVTLLFEKDGNNTKFTLHHVGIPEGELNDATAQGWNSSFDKLNEIL